LYFLIMYQSPLTLGGAAIGYQCCGHVSKFYLS
jgi:hypothetical protein